MRNKTVHAGKFSKINTRTCLLIWNLRVVELFKEEYHGVKASCSTGSEHSVALSDKQWDTYSKQKL